MTPIEKFIKSCREIEARATPGEWAGLIGMIAGNVNPVVTGPCEFTVTAPLDVVNNPFGDIQFITFSRNNWTRVIDALECSITTLERVGQDRMVKGCLSKIESMLGEKQAND